MRIVVLLGPESSGKSALAAQLQHRFGAIVLGEYVREYIDTHQRDTHYGDIEVIAREQLSREDAARAAQPPLLVLDTHLLSNILWSRALFNDCPAWLEPALSSRHYDLHLLLAPEGVPWVADGQRCQPELGQRQAFHHACEAWLTEHQQRWVPLRGSWAQREVAAIAAVEQLLGADQRI
jgi:nicotinamide riboside kinase